jgi:GT2 family glycosyltransferase
VHAVRGTYTHYLFLNNDTAAGNFHWLEHMLGFGQRPDVGIVGATLLYPDHRVQHAGVLVGLFGVAEHAYKFWNFFAAPERREIGEVGGLLANRDYSAVTAACMLMRADVFEAVGGFDERLAVGFNDTDICLRTKAAGYKVIQDAFAILYHYESQSRGLAATDPHPKDTARFISRHRHMVFAGDPYYSPLQSTNTTFFHLDRLSKSRKKLRFRTTRVVLPARA